ncbi:unnamed protein product [[Candida] boidinii]|uniref:Unnamed protein product n=1 Tax=Candida boidinii TaxID=5477 RepID=A0A9W6T4X8_CANBO|nr:hypothetical protein BVG19_g1049 [[Candida] boidinii]OWB50658.1 hypothetical protein B5S27_g2210 [[Candida] boidinii]OWB66971.1 hypothetical protein B5S30_g2320 [[Candida] boidinii]OWB82737.1 hypothetical protein B5S33_g1365 [[Candida] boidinii]GME75985.1 unnamed protein product [[Candida] boidinii]
MLSVSNILNSGNNSNANLSSVSEPLSKSQVEMYKSILTNLETQYYELKDKYNEDDDSMNLIIKLKVTKLLKTCEVIKFKNFENGSYKDQSLQKSVHKIDKLLKDLKFDCDYNLELTKIRHDELEAIKLQEKELEKIKENGDLIGVSLSTSTTGGSKEEESIESLRRRLLSTNRGPSKLDEAISIEQKNEYNENLHKEYLKDISTFINQAKDTALKFQEMIANDSVILKEATEQLEKSNGNMSKISNVLKKYHSSGKLGFWFYLRILSLVLISFILFVLVIRILSFRII